MRDRLKNYLKAGYPAIAITTTEERRAVADVIAVAKSLDRKVATWSATEGVVIMPSKRLPDTEDLLAACRTKHENSVFILRDIHRWPLNQDPILGRAFRDLLDKSTEQGTTVIIISPEYRPASDVEKLVTMMEYSLPSADDLMKIAIGIAESANKDIKADELIINALSGLSTSESENALALSLIETGGFSAEVIYREKTAAVKRSGLLEIIEPEKRGLEAIGGMNELKNWIMLRKKSFTKEAIEYGLPFPKGVLLAGVPGGGKSLAAKAIGTALNIPTLRLDIGSLFSSLVGESESKTRQALALADAIAPCVIFMDEIEKGLAGSSGSGNNDSGVTKRVFGTIITWMQERKKPCFLIATANDVTSLPPEFLRKGRWDEIFAVDLPNEVERKKIFEIHLTKRKRDPKKFNISTLVSVSKEFTGSEIEAAIESAMFKAFDDGREIETADIATACSETVPLAQTAKEKVESIREWAKGRARMASSSDEAPTQIKMSTRKIST